MRLRNLVPIACALAAFGCSQAPKAVFVNLDTIERRDSAPTPGLPPIGEVASTIILPRVAILPPLRSVTIQDLAADQIGEARRLIAEDRQRAVATMTRQLGEARKKEIDAQRIAAEQELENRLEDYWSAVYDRLYATFRAYALERGPTEMRLEVLRGRRPEIFPSRAAFTEMVMKPTMADQDEAEIREKFIRLAELDAKYQTEATDILESAHANLDADRVAIRRKYDQLTSKALQEAAREAAEAIRRVGASSDLNLGQNRSVTVSPVAGTTIAVPGSETTAAEFVGLTLAPVTARAERRRSLEAQLEIWLKTSGYVRARTRKGANDHTEVFDSWRKTQRLGP